MAAGKLPARFTIRKPEAEVNPGRPLSTRLADYRPYIIYRCVVGSQAYGLAEAGSDIDRRGIFPAAG